MSVRQAIGASLRLLAPRDRRRLVWSTLAQMATSLLDLVGVVLVGSVGALSAAALVSQAPPQRLTSAAAALGLDGLSLQSLIVVLTCAAAVALLAKSVISPLLAAQVLRFLASREVAVATRLTRELLSRPLTFVQMRSTQDTSAAIVQAANAATTIVLGQTVIAVAELTLLAVLSTTLLLFDPPLALGVIVFFGAIGFGLQRVLGARATRYGAARLGADVASLRAIQEALGSYREITVADRRAFFGDRIQRLRTDAAQASAKQQFLYILPKYVAEAALVVGAFTLAAWLFTTRSIEVAAGTFTLFLAAATRIMPSLLRLQTAMLAIRGAAGSATRTFTLADDLSTDPTSPDPVRGVAPTGHYPDFVPSVELKGVGFAYPDNHVAAISDISLQIRAGQSVALVGRSGAGKSTLADMILGVLDPQQGSVLVGGVAPMVAIQRWPGGIAYVPQDVMLTNDSIRNNVALGLPPALIDDTHVWDALNSAYMGEYVRAQPDGLDSQVGERGLRLSGGQRQRLGIARALFSRPRLLVLDEATSALDAETEQAITQLLDALAEDVTTVIIAHRLSTVRHADLVVYLDNGAEIAAGSFEEVCEQVPALQRQSDLMGLR